jgi:MscS family membrane protein
MRTFLTAFAEGNLDEAVACLDLSEIAANIRAIRGRELATQLKNVVDRIERVELDEIPRRTSAPPYEFAPDIVIAPDERGEWLFTAETVAAIPDLDEEYRDREIVEGVTRAAPTPSMWLRSHMPRRLQESTFLLEHWQWLGLAVLIFLGFVADRVFTAILGLVVARHMESRLLQIKSEVLRTGLRPLGLLATAAVWWLGLAWLGLPDQPLLVLSVAVRFVAATALVWASYRLVDVATSVFEQRAERTASKYDDLLVPLVRKSAKVFIAAFGLLFVADSVNLPIASLIAGLGLSGIAVALAGQDVIKNLFGSVMVLLDRPFHVGDWIVTSGLEGTVEEVGFRSTRIRTFYDSLITLPNSNLMNAAVDNLGARQYRRWKSTLAITYDTPPEKVDAFCEGIRELVRRHPYTRKDSFQIYMNDFGAASLDILLYVFFETPDWATELRERHRLAVDILRLAARLGVEFAFPTQTLYLHRASADGSEAAEHARLYTSRVDDAVSGGRREAMELVESVVGDERPPPVGVEAPAQAMPRGGSGRDPRDPVTKE